MLPYLNIPSFFAFFRMTIEFFVSFGLLFPWEYNNTKY